MTFLDNPTDWLALRISESYGTREAEAKGSICIFLLGCYCKIHKPFLEKAKKGILSLKVSCMMMEDLKIEMDESPSPNYAIKFQLTCDEMLKSFKLPLPFLYAPKPETQCGSGFISELVTLCENPKYEKLKDNTRLFTENNSNLPHHEKLVANFPITDGEDFVKHAVERAQIEINMMLDIITRHRGV